MRLEVLAFLAPLLSQMSQANPTEVQDEEVLLSEEDPLSDLKIIDQLLRTYDRRATPTNKIGRPTEVGCELFIRSFGSISEKTMDYQVDLYLRQHWQDSRLNHSAIKEALDLNDPNLVKAIWKPEVYFPNAKEGEFQYVTVPNVLLRIKPHGQILYMLRLKMKFSCMMGLFKYPLDEQVCTMEVASFSKTTRELLLQWNKENPVELSSDLRMPQFIVKDVVTDRCNYSCLVARFHLSRSVGFHMVQSYIPTILIVVISWVSFWMDVDSVPGRTTLGVTTLLTVSSKSAGLNAETPQVSYVKAIDVWMGACTAFIFAALVEFTIVNYLWRKHSNTVNDDATVVGQGLAKTETMSEDIEMKEFSASETHQSLLDVKNSTKNTSDKESTSIASPVSRETGKKLASGQSRTPRRLESRSSSASSSSSRLGLRIDEACRILFPLNFLCFNVGYWWYYLYY